MRWRSVFHAWDQLCDMLHFARNLVLTDRWQHLQAKQATLYFTHKAGSWSFITCAQSPEQLKQNHVVIDSCWWFPVVRGRSCYQESSKCVCGLTWIQQVGSASRGPTSGTTITPQILFFRNSMYFLSPSALPPDSFLVVCLLMCD